jgi:hypothetical protein
MEFIAIQSHFEAMPLTVPRIETGLSKGLLFSPDE